MFGIGGGELFFIILVVLMLFGSDKIPDIARALGKGMAQLKNATNEIKTEISKNKAYSFNYEYIANELKNNSILKIKSNFQIRKFPKYAFSPLGILL